MTSSGTTGQSVSRIFLDKTTAARQQKTLVRIVNHFTGAGRLPMLIIDTPAVMKDRNMFSAAGIGFSIFGSDRFYALNDDMTLNYDGVNAFLARHQGKSILLFGFTFMVWQHFYQALNASGQMLDRRTGSSFMAAAGRNCSRRRLRMLSRRRCTTSVV
jgi:hypothetical protein